MGLEEIRGALVELAFDKRLGIRTTSVIQLDELGIAHPERLSYRPIPWRSLKRVLRAVDVAAGEDVLLDLGSGLGRAVLVAAGYPFRRVIGVELSSDLHALALQNLERYRGRRRAGAIELLNQDALTYPIPPDVSYVLLSNPFTGGIFRSVLERLLDSVDAHPRTLRLIYVNPIEDQRVLATGRARIVHEHQPRRRRDDPTAMVRVYELVASTI